MLVSNHTLAAKITNKIFSTAIIVLFLAFFVGCNPFKGSKDIAILPRLEDASKAQLIEETNRLAKVGSLRGKFSVVFEDTTSAGVGKSDKYQSANGDIIVQRPDSIYLKIDAFSIDIAQMTSNGKNFHVAVLEDGGSGKYKKFLTGSNGVDYSPLQKVVSDIDPGAGDKAQVAKKNVNAFSNIRPQHFTDALLIKPAQSETGDTFYVQSEIFQDETNPNSRKNSTLTWINHGYYLLDELKKKGDELVLSRRFWFSRIDRIRLARQQIFDDAGGLESDIEYGSMGNFTATREYQMPLQIVLTRPKEKYKMTMTYKNPEEVIIGKEWAAKIFNLENRWDLPEVDLDKKLAETKPVGTQTAGKSEQR